MRRRRLATGGHAAQRLGRWAALTGAAPKGAALACAAAACAALAGAALMVPAAVAHDDGHVASAADTPQRIALLRSAEAALERGDTAAAAADFEHAARMRHSADTEMGIVRAQMQAGEYRHALAFCAHVAGAHLEAPDAAGLYAWLLRVGGQPAVADRVLAEARARAPADAVVAAVTLAFAAPDGGIASGVLLDLPHRMAPPALMAAGQDAPPPGAAVVASGVLIDEGRRALVPWAAVRGTSMLWVRNGLGQTTAATLRPSNDALTGMGLAVLELAAPMPAGDAALARPVGPDPFAGSPGFAFEYARSDDAAPAWPRLHQGFLGGFVDGAGGDAAARRLGIDVPAGAHGGPVLDAAGRWAGVVGVGPDGCGTLVPLSLFRGALAGAPGVAAPFAKGTTIGVDAAYELGLRATLQLIAAR